MADPNDAALRRPRRRQVLITSIATAALLGIGLAAFASTSSSGERYRTAVAGPASIDQTVEAVGSATPASPKTYAFSIGGTVSSVGVAVGQVVAAGQVLASLNATTLNSTLAQAQLTLANDRLTLENDETGKGSSSGSTSGSSGSRGGTSGGTQASAPAAASGPSASDVSAAQKAVTTAQHLVDTDLAAQQTLLTTANTVCADPTKSATDCQTADQNVLTAQTKTSADEAALLTAEKQLSSVLNQGAASTTASPTPTPSNASGQVASPAQLAADQAAIDAAQAQVAVAQDNVDRASLVATSGGTVMSVGLTTGATVSANSTTATVVVADPSSFAFSLTVPVVALNSLQVGDHATVLPDGTSNKLAATVASVGLAPTTTGGSSYAVTVGLASQPAGLRSGMSGTVAIDVSTASAAIAVPLSALTRSDTTYTVTTLTNGKPVTKTVAVGVMGSSLVQITSGLAAGDVVVLADRHTKLPSASTNNRLLTGVTGSGLTGGTAGGFGGATGGTGPGRGTTSRN